MTDQPPRDEGMRSVFDAAYYVSCYRDELAAGEDPLDHFLRVGLARHYRPHPAFDPLLERLARPGIDDARLLAMCVARGPYVEREGDPYPPPGLVPVATVLPGITRDDRLRAGPCPVDKDIQDYLTARHLGSPHETAFECDGRRYRLASPAAEYFLDRLRRDEPFAIARLSHADWDCLALLGRYRRRVTETCADAAVDRETADLLAQRICTEFHEEDEGIFTEHFITELNRDLQDPVQDPRFFTAVAFKGYPSVDDRLFVWQQTATTAADELDRMRLVAAMFPPDGSLLDATLWKRWLVNGELADLPTLVRNRPVILVGADRLGTLGTRWNLDTFHHVRIPPWGSPAQRYAILDACRDTLATANAQSRQRGLGRPVCILQGSSFAYWLMRRLFLQFPDTFYMDLGQALHAWFYDDRDIPLMPWGKLYAPDIVRNGRMEDYYERLGVPPPVLDHLFRERAHSQILAALHAPART